MRLLDGAERGYNPDGPGFAFIEREAHGPP
jgi:hypothetical protein